MRKDSFLASYWLTNGNLLVILDRVRIGLEITSVTRSQWFG
jgi:hypothetical protein